jgi:hypothetical protein
MKSIKVTDEEFLEVWNDAENYSTIALVAEEFGITWRRAANRASELRSEQRTKPKKSRLKVLNRAQKNFASPIPETHYNFREGWNETDCVTSLQNFAARYPGRNVSRIFYRTNTEISDSTWNRYFGTFLEFKRQAGLILTRDQHKVERQIAKHVSVDHYRALNERHEFGDKYIRDSGKDHKVIMGISDLHDIEIDPFLLRVFIEAVKLVQPDIINLGGDIFDLPEFGKYGVDPREWDVVGRIKFAHDHILRPIREAAPNAQIDFVEGNHEYRLLRHMSDGSQALKTVLADLHGFTIPKLLGLDEFELNYISKADLGAFTEAEKRKEVGKSYIVYEDALLVHHHPYAAQWGLPGWNGHHHKWLVAHHKNVTRGAYQWMQLGCGHMLSASYTEGEFWTLGFNIAHLNSKTKAVNFEYVSVTEMASIGGRFMYRKPSEMIGFYAPKNVKQ